MGKRLWSFRGGIRLSGHKALSAGGEIRSVPLPDKLVLALRQHSGRPAIPLVDVGDRVTKGQCIARAAEGISAALHAPTSGTITAIAPAPLAHPSGESDMCIQLRPDGEDEWCHLFPVNDPLHAPVEELVARIAEAGVVGLGGAVFPSAIKLDPKTQPEILIINGVECEPYITCDDILMRKRPGDILHGIAVLLHVTGAQQCLVGIEDNKPQAIAEMQTRHRELLAEQLPGMERIEIVAVPTRFPAGGEKQLIYTLTGREVPSGKLPRDIGVVCNNVGTAAAIHDAVFKGQPLLSRIVTLTGEALPSPANFEVLIGTPVGSLLKLAGLEDASGVELVMGGPMMGFPISSVQVAINKGSNCILARPQHEQSNAQHAACIRCGSCVSVCPASLLPQQLYWYSRAQKFDKSEAHHLFDCIECGCCAHVCPSHIPLVEYFRYAKHAVADQRRRQRKAETARQRNELRLARLEKEKQEKEAARAKRRAARKAASKTTTTGDANTDATPETVQKAS